MDNDRPHIEVTLVSYRGLVDKSLNLTFNVSEQFKRTALELFSDIGATGYLFRITPEAAREKMMKDYAEGKENEPVKPPPEPTGNNCNKAINLCKDKDFWRFLEFKYKIAMITSEYFADKQLKKALGFTSKRNLDDFPELAKDFWEFISEFEAWLPGNGEL